MAVNFPENPNIGQQFSEAGKLYLWDGSRWIGTLTQPDTFIISELSKNIELVDDDYDPDGDGIDEIVVSNDLDFETPPLTFALLDNAGGEGTEAIKKDPGIGIGYYPVSNTLFAQKLVVSDISTPAETRNNLSVGESGISFGPAGNQFFSVDSESLVHAKEILSEKFTSPDYNLLSSDTDDVTSQKTGELKISRFGTFSLNGEGNASFITGYTIIPFTFLKLELYCWTDDNASYQGATFEVRRVDSTYRIIDDRGTIIDIPTPDDEIILTPTRLDDPNLGVAVRYDLAQGAASFFVASKTAGPKVGKWKTIITALANS